MNEVLAVRFLHFVGFVLWLGGLLATALLLRAAASARLAAILADCGSMVTLATGLYTAVNRSLFSQPWLHLKLTLVAALLGLHVALRIRVRTKEGRSTGAMAVIVGLLGCAILYVIVFRPFAR